MGRAPLPFNVPDTSCPPGGGGGGGGGFDVEGFVLCDFVDDTIVGSAIAVYEYDTETGLPVGAPSFVDPETGDPYVVQGTLAPCSTGTAEAAVTLTSHHFLATSGSNWTPALVTGALTSLSYTVLSGTVDVTAGGVTVSDLPVGVSAAWDAADHDTLTGPTLIAPDAASSALVVWTER